MEPLRRPNHSEMRQLREEWRKLMARWEAVIRRGSELEEELNRGLSALRESSVLETLREVDIDQAEHPDGPIRTAALHKAGIHTVADVLSHSRKELVDLPGFGETSARRVLEASERIAETARQSAQVRLGREDPASVPVLRTIYRALRERPMAEEAAR